MVVWVAIVVYLGHKRKQNDSVWHIPVEELDFNDPPDIIGQGKQYITRGERCQQAITAEPTTYLPITSSVYFRGLRSGHSWSISWN